MGIRNIRYSHLSAVLFGAAVVIAATACSDSGNNSVAPVGATITVNTGSNAQGGTVGQALGQAISVRVVDQDGNAVPNTAVGWTIESGGGSVDSATTITDISGDASILWTLGDTAGVDSLKATIANGTSSTGISTFVTATANASAAVSIAMVSGDAQSIAAGSTSQPLVAKVTDQFGNGVANSAVNWTVVGGGTLSNSSSTTDTNGLAQITLATDPTAATYTVTATGPSGTAVTFTVTGS